MMFSDNYLVSLVAEFMPSHDELVSACSHLKRMSLHQQMMLGLRTQRMLVDEECVAHDLSLLDTQSSLEVGAIIFEHSRPDLVANTLLLKPDIWRFDTIVRGLICNANWDHDEHHDLYVALKFIGYVDGIIPEEEYDDDEIDEFDDLTEACKYDYILVRYSKYFGGCDLPSYGDVVHGRCASRMIELIGRVDEAMNWFYP